MEDKLRYAVVVAVVAVAALAAYYSGIFAVKGQPDLALNVVVSPDNPFAGEAAEFKITVSNTGQQDADSVLVMVSDGNAVIARKTVSVAAQRNAIISIKWLASAPGNHSVRIVVDAGNVISESDESNNEFTSTILVLPREEPNVFRMLPDEGIVRAYYFNASTGGLNQVIGILGSGSENAEFYSTLFNKLNEGHLGILHYANGSEAAALTLQSALTWDEFVSAAGVITGGSMISREEMVNGSRVVVLESKDGITSICLFRKGGWGNAVMYKRYFPQVNVFNSTIGESTTCMDIIAHEYDPKNASELLGATKPLAGQAYLNDTTLLEASVRSGKEKLYARGFNDSNSAFLLMVSDAGILTPERCPGEMISEENRSICHMEHAALMEKVELEAYARKQGQYTIVVFIAPFQNTNMAKARETALGVVKSVVFPGVEEYVWGTTPTQLSFCEFPNTLLCTSPVFENNTLKLNITSLSTKPISITGFKCTQEMQVPTQQFALTEAIALQPDQTIGITQPCYYAGEERMEGTLMFLRAQLFVNITDADTNESRILKGMLLVNNMEGTTPPGQ